ncbi:MAG: S-methyl-5'-thioadenosine phosphorylase [Capsulimonadaceae bacterium]|nr:S-methyl-5'-thioadenosine phosphorylase [Capsulimonadaceae bacterium]
MDNETIGIFGGSGFYDFAEAGVEEIRVDTPYGPPSDKLARMTVAGRNVVFLPRHGHEHTIPPHRINFRANLWAMKELGVTRIIAPSAVGSLQPNIAPGDFVINDQFVDRTSGRIDTFFDGPVVTHVSTAEPYCPSLRALAIAAARQHGVTVHETGTAVTIQGPRFSTKAESRWFGSQGWSIVGMTQYPEVALARELAICYTAISLVTDYDTGVQIEGGTHVEVTDVMAVMRRNVATVKKVIRTMLEKAAPVRECVCAHALDHARM